jgi:hypothetical protein
MGRVACPRAPRMRRRLDRRDQLAYCSLLALRRPAVFSPYCVSLPSVNIAVKFERFCSITRLTEAP